MMKKGRYETNSRSVLLQRIALIVLAVIVLAGVVCYFLSLHAMGKVTDAIEEGKYAEALTLYRDSNAVFRRLGRGKVRSVLEEEIPDLSEDALKSSGQKAYDLALAVALSEQTDAMQLLEGNNAYRSVCEAIDAGDFVTAEEVYADMNDFGYERYYDEITERFYTAIRETPYPVSSSELVNSSMLRIYESMQVFAQTMQLPTENNDPIRYVELVCSLGDYELFNEVCAAFQATMPDVQKMLSSAKSELKRQHANTAVLKARLGELEIACETLAQFDETAYLVSDYSASLQDARDALQEVLADPDSQEAAFEQLTEANDTFLDVLALIGSAISDVSEIRTNLPVLR